MFEILTKRIYELTFRIHTYKLESDNELEERFVRKYRVA